jgi:hypothetical protein
MSSKKSKKKHSKKQQFKYAVPTVTPAQSSPASVQMLSKASLAVSAPAVTTAIPGIDRIRRDVRRVLVLAASFVLLELVLWYLFSHTALGPAVYKLIKL